jgi:hypothetical protein
MPDTPTMDTVYFYKFNNYYNRIIKRYDTVEEYGEPLTTQANCNFVHGDGVNSSFTLNKGTNIVDTPDYCVVVDYNNTISRWFVINSFKNRNGQDRLTLRRDLIADFYSDVLQYSPCLIRKGYVPQTSPFIFNDEGVRYNKMKTEEILIKDRSNCSYIIGFISKNAAAKATINGTIKDTDYDFYFSDLNAFPWKEYVEGAGQNHTLSATMVLNPNYNINYAVRFTSIMGIQNPYNAEMTFNYYGGNKPTYYTNQYASGTKINNNLYYKQEASRASNLVISANGSANTVLEAYYNLFVEKHTNNQYIQQRAKILLNLDEDDYYNLKAYDQKKVKIGNVVYKVSMGVSANAVTPVQADNVLTGLMNNRLPSENEVENMLPWSFHSKYDDTYNELANADIKVVSRTYQYYLVFTEATTSIHTAVDSPSNRTHLTEQPYDMFVMINDDNVPYKVGIYDFVSNHEVNMNMAQSIIEEYADAAYDVQVVPFNPIEGSILADGTINWLNYDTHAILDAANNVVGHYVFCNSADLRTIIDKDELKFHPEDYKKDYNLKQYRLCSPNQETIFEFSPSMNGGIDTWEVTFNYRPYASYIKIQPTWGWLYGNSFYNELTDFRGLLYNSSLCVTQLNDAWASYVNSNKNYQQIFDTQINTLSKSQQVQVKAMEETLGWRSYTGMPISSIARVIGGSKDIEMTKELNNLALSKMSADFNYQMDNIQSMPNTIRKLTNINGDTRIFPYIEVYSCSPDEEQSFELKMKYTGYTIMTTGYIWNYLKEGEETFIQADLIRLDLSRSEESADNHIAIEIADELDKGLYITKESE